MTFLSIQHDRYKKMAEQHYKETKAAREAEHSDSGYRFDMALCRKTFDEYDKDESGYLDIKELTKLAEVMQLNALSALAASPCYCCDN